ncbi:TPA: carbon storage regulator [Staphylococcus aureus]
MNGSHVKFGVDAPAGVHVHRSEVYQKIRDRQGAAAPALATPNP